MTIQELGSIGELVAAIATVLTLAYLALQIRQNTQQLQNSGRDARTSASVAYSQIEQNFLLQLGLNGKAGAVYFKGLADYDSLDDDELAQFTWLISAYITNFRQTYYLNEEGVISSGLWEQHLRSFEWVAAQPGFRGYWERWRELIGPEVGGLIDDLIASSKGAAGDAG